MIIFDAETVRFIRSVVNQVQFFFKSKGVHLEFVSLYIPFYKIKWIGLEKKESWFGRRDWSWFSS